MKIFLDTEFTQLIKNTSLISLGLIDEEGNSFYAEFTDYNKDLMDNWIRDNVIAHTKFLKDGYTGRSVLNINQDYSEREICGDSQTIKKELTLWLKNYEKIEWVSDICHYDFVLLIDLLYGSAINIPSNVSINCYDINQDIAKYFRVDTIEASDKSREIFLKMHNANVGGNKHNALYDAKVIKKIYEIIHKPKTYGEIELIYNDRNCMFKSLVSDRVFKWSVLSKREVTLKEIDTNSYLTDKEEYGLWKVIRV